MAESKERKERSRAVRWAFRRALGKPPQIGIRTKNGALPENCDGGLELLDLVGPGKGVQIGMGLFRLQQGKPVAVGVDSRLDEVVFRVVGTAPYCTASCCLPCNGLEEPRTHFEKLEQNLYMCAEGWCGIPTGYFKAVMVGVAPFVGSSKSSARKSIIVVPDGVDVRRATPLVRLIKGDANIFIAHVRLYRKRVFRYSLLWATGWEAVLRIRYAKDLFTVVDILQLVQRAGMQVGIGEGRCC